jgi:hypothetical protein
MPQFVNVQNNMINLDTVLYIERFKDDSCTIHFVNGETLSVYDFNNVLENLDSSN